MKALNDRARPDFTIHRVDPSNAAHTRALLDLLDEYAAGPTGRGAPLDAESRARLPGLLARRPHYLGWLAFVGTEAAGLINCFEGVSTFRAQPLLNVHDITVTPRYRRRGIATALLRQAEQAARELGCCKVTLEVLEGNIAAARAYRQAGYEAYALDPAMGRALFLEKKFY